MFLCDTSSMKTDSLFPNDFSFVFTPVKEKPQESTLFLACLQLDPLSDSFSSDFVFIYTVYCIHWILDKSTDVITPMSCRTADATTASARSEVIYLSHAIANAEKFRQYPATTGTSIST